MNRHVTAGILLLVIGVFSLVGAAGIWIYNYVEESTAANASLQTVNSILDRIGQVGAASSESTASAGMIISPGGAVPADIPEISEDMGDMRFMVVDNAAYLGVLNIPRLNLSLPVNTTWSYPSLKNSPCRYYGNIDDNSMVIAAHNYAQHFGSINTLSAGDDILLTDVDGNVISYSVQEIETVDPDSAIDVIDSEFDLTLFTCTYTSTSRVVVRCTRS